jgi:hypothetical protein
MPMTAIEQSSLEKVQNFLQLGLRRQFDRQKARPPHRGGQDENM